jgi:Phage terminase, small subunit
VNERQKKFCLLVFEGGRPATAYLQAGYKANPHAAEVSASRLMRSAEVRNHLAEMGGKAIAAASERVTGFLVTKQWVIDRLVDNVNRAMQAVPVLNADGEPSGVFTWQGHVANKALELLGTELGMFVERSEMDQTIKILTDKPMSHEEWALRYAVNLPPLKLVKPVDRE